MYPNDDWAPMPQSILNKIKVNDLTAFSARKIGKMLCHTIDSFIFVANTGRCGSESLQKIFDSVPDCASLHEPHPALTGQLFREYNELREDNFLKDFYQRKLPNIYWAAKRKRFYVETSNMFIKVYAEEILRNFSPKLKIINLFRDKEMVAASLYRRHEFSNEGRLVANDWILHPQAARNQLRIGTELAEGGKYSHQYFRYLWYCYEIEIRTRNFAKKYPEVPMFDFRTEDLNNVQAIKKLLSDLGIDPPPDIEKLLGVKHNASKVNPEPPEDVTKKQILEFHEYCTRKMLK